MRKVIVAGAVLVLVAVAGPAGAAPEYVSSEPAAGEQVHRAPARVSITFSEPLDSSSSIKVYDECGGRVDAGDTEVELNQTTMSVGIADEPSGTYTVRYTATGVGGLTGTTNGSFEFLVHAGESCDGGGGGHEHDDDDDGNEKDHEGHEKGNGHDDSDDHTDHADDGDGDGDHDDHAAGSGDHADHDGAKDEPGQSDQDDRAKREREFAFGESAFPDLEPEGWAVIVALAMCGLIGTVGGFTLRVIER